MPIIELQRRTGQWHVTPRRVAVQTGEGSTCRRQRDGRSKAAGTREHGRATCVTGGTRVARRRGDS